MCNISPRFKRSRMCREEAHLWASAYVNRLAQDPAHFDSEFEILNSYPPEVIQELYKIVPSVTEYIRTHIRNS